MSLEKEATKEGSRLGKLITWSFIVLASLAGVCYTPKSAKPVEYNNQADGIYDTNGLTPSYLNQASNDD